MKYADSSEAPNRGAGMSQVFNACLLRDCKFMNVRACLVRCIRDPLCSRVLFVILTMRRKGKAQVRGRFRQYLSYCPVLRSSTLIKDGAIADSRGGNRE